MIKIKAPKDHNWTHLRYPRTLWEAFQGKGDMHISAPTHEPVDPKVLALFVLQWVTMLFFSFVVFYLVAYV
jgi:hypothetical protein